MAELNMVGWWYIAENQRQGPVTLPTLEKLLQHRILGAESLVWHEGLPAWTKLADIEELKPLLLSPPPLLTAPPPLLPATTHGISAAQSVPAAPPSAATRAGTGRHLLVAMITASVLLATAAAIYLAPRAFMAGWAGHLRQTLTLTLFHAIPPQRREASPETTAVPEHYWQNPLTRKQAYLGSDWTIKQLGADQNTIASSFITNNIVVNVSVAAANNQTLEQLVDYLKAHEPNLRFISGGTYSQANALPNWTGIAINPADSARHYVVHVTDAKTGYGIFIAAINQQTADSLSRLENVMAELDRTFKEN